MLAFASDLHARLARVGDGDGAGGVATAARMGVATGDVAFLIGDDDGNGFARTESGPGAFVSVQVTHVCACACLCVHASMCVCARACACVF